MHVHAAFIFNSLFACFLFQKVCEFAWLEAESEVEVGLWTCLVSYNQLLYVRHFNNWLLTE